MPKSVFTKDLGRGGLHSRVSKKLDPLFCQQDLNATNFAKTFCFLKFVAEGYIRLFSDDTWFPPRLPDFSWSKIPKRGKIYQITTNYTKNGQKILSMALK
jgi:hypothetical protein